MQADAGLKSQIHSQMIYFGNKFTLHSIHTVSVTPLGEYPVLFAIVSGIDFNNHY